MSAEMLRKAAALMRERAEAARKSPWIQNGGNGIHTIIGQCVATTAAHDDDLRKAEARHIASWHPDVALAVADLLDAQAALVEETGGFFDIAEMGDANALAVARAYLDAPDA